MTEKKLIASMTDDGNPALWESGGSWGRTGRAVIICSKHGKKKSPAYIRKRGRITNDDHALIPIEIGDVVVSASHYSEDFEIGVFTITEIGDPVLKPGFISASSDFVFYVTLKQELAFDFGRWDRSQGPPCFLVPVVKAAMEKATCYNCRKAHWIKKEESDGDD